MSWYYFTIDGYFEAQSEDEAWDTLSDIVAFAPANVEINEETLLPYDGGVDQ